MIKIAAVTAGSRETVGPRRTPQIAASTSFTSHGNPYERTIGDRGASAKRSTSIQPARRPCASRIKTTATLRSTARGPKAPTTRRRNAARITTLGTSTRKPGTRSLKGVRSVTALSRKGSSTAHLVSTVMICLQRNGVRKLSRSPQTRHRGALGRERNLPRWINEASGMSALWCRKSASGMGAITRSQARRTKTEIPWPPPSTSARTIWIKSKIGRVRRGRNCRPWRTVHLP